MRETELHGHTPLGNSLQAPSRFFNATFMNEGCDSIIASYNHAINSSWGFSVLLFVVFLMAFTRLSLGVFLEKIGLNFILMKFWG